MQRNTTPMKRICRCTVFSLTAIVLASAGAAQGVEPETAGRTPPPIDPGWLDRELRAQDIEDLLEGRSRPGSAEASPMFSQAEMFFEENSTDGDLGIQFALDGAPWERVMIFDPRWRKYIDVRARGNGRRNGITGLFSESAEPGFDDVPKDQFLAWFPEGEYLFVGWSTEGELLASLATLTHEIPLGPETIYPGEDDEVDADEPLVIEWMPTPDPDFPESVIVGYQVIVTRESGPDGEFIIDLGPEATTVTVPPEFLESATEYKYEVLAKETSGNQTITEVPFHTGD